MCSLSTSVYFSNVIVVLCHAESNARHWQALIGISCPLRSIDTRIQWGEGSALHISQRQRLEELHPPRAPPQQFHFLLPLLPAQRPTTATQRAVCVPLASSSSPAIAVLVARGRGRIIAAILIGLRSGPETRCASSALRSGTKLVIQQRHGSHQWKLVCPNMGAGDIRSKRCAC